MSEKGIRCCYHGWLFDVDGTVLETPGEPPDAKLKDSFYQGAYPARELEGLVHVYMGPPDLVPHRPHYVKAQVRVHEYPDGTLAVFHGPRSLARYHADGEPLETPTRKAA